MEGMGLFNVAGTGGDSNMRTAVHTRRIVDPAWGSKIIGTAGRTTFGVLNAEDESPGSGAAVCDAAQPICEPGGPTVFTIARATYALRRADYLGAIVTDTHAAGKHNRVVGGDLVVKPSVTQQINAAVLSSRTDDESAGDTRGSAAQVSYSYETRRATVVTQVEHYDRGFEMDTAFYNRTGFTSAWSFGEVNMYPRSGADFWLQRVHPYFFAKRGRDDTQGGTEALLNTGIRVNTTRQGFLDVSRGRGHEAWQGQEYTVGRDLNVSGQVQIVRWLNVDGGFNIGPAIYYDLLNPYQGRSRSSSFGITFQPDQHYTLQVNANLDRFDRDATAERIYTVDIVNAKTTYQFDKHFLVRVLEEFDSSTHRLLTDVLASYEFVPGTVFHAGYGSLYERNATHAGPLVPGGVGDRYVLTNRGLFFKASYVHRF